MPELSLREFGLLVQGALDEEGLDVCGIVSPNAWAFFEDIAYSDEKHHRFIEVARYRGKKALRVKNFVGVIAAPDGTHIEILPKIAEAEQDKTATRMLLWKMLDTVENLHFLEATDAQLSLRSMPLIEALVSIFLDQVGSIVRGGIRRDYERVENEENFLRGRLQMMRQMRQPPGRQHKFRIEYDLFSENRAENRLIHAALVKVARSCKTAANQRRARELRHGFESVPISDDIRTDFQNWKSDRGMAYYQPLLPWLRLILNQQCPFALKDQHDGISFLFPMESLFEKYVAEMLARPLRSYGVTVHTQLRGEYLADRPRAFLLKPDFACKRGQHWLCILDTKWKLIDQYAGYNNGAADPKAGISQGDMYQLFAYGHKYLGGRGRLMLIYPQWSGFSTPLPSFDLGNGLILEVMPFDLSSDGAKLIEHIAAMP